MFDIGLLIACLTKLNKSIEERKKLQRHAKRGRCLPETPVYTDWTCPDNAIDLELWLLEKEEALREEGRMLETLHRIVVQVIRLIIVIYSSIITSSGKKLRVRNRYEKVVMLILWRCGDIEKNPGPPIPDVRSFCKKMISLLVIKYWESKEGEELHQADYKRIPVEWPDHLLSKFKDPSKCDNETRNTMLTCLLEICIAEEVELPDEWLTLIEKIPNIAK